jgi:hypothetical protein
MGKVISFEANKASKSLVGISTNVSALAVGWSEQLEKPINKSVPRIIDFIFLSVLIE